MKMRRLIKALFSRKKKNAAAIYLSRFDTIDKMIREKLIGIDVKECYVAIDLSVHLLYKDDDRKYAAFFDTLRAFINYHRGYMDLPVLQPEERINFCVNFRREIRFDLENEEFYDEPRVEYIPWLVGFCQSGTVVYDVFEQGKK